MEVNRRRQTARSRSPKPEGRDPEREDRPEVAAEDRQETPEGKAPEEGAKGHQVEATMS